MRKFNSITKGLRKIIAKLESLDQRNAKEADNKEKSIITLQQEIAQQELEIDGLLSEGVRATETAGKLRALIGE